MARRCAGALGCQPIDIAEPQALARVYSKIIDVPRGRRLRLAPCRSRRKGGRHELSEIPEVQARRSRWLGDVPEHWNVSR